MTTDLQASVEYLRGYDPNKDGVSSDFLTHIANVARAYLAENDPTPLTIEDVERLLGKKDSEDLVFDVRGGMSIEFDHYDDRITTWADDGDGDPKRLKTLTTHGEFRTFCRLFKIEVKA